jgi:hypothetical protein
MNSSSDFKKILDKYSRGECNSHEQMLVDNWYSNISSDSKQLIDVDSVQERLWLKLNPEKSKKKNQRIFFRIAASFLAFITVGSLFYINFSKGSSSKSIAFNKMESTVSGQLKQVVNNTSAIRLIRLEDGSEVKLNPKSEISYQEYFNDDERKVYLKGEAFFNVTKDKLRPFIVITNDVTTRVLGTSFNIKAYDNEKQVTVAVVTGKVSVITKATKVKNSTTDRREIILTPNQQIIYNRDNERIAKQLVATPEIILHKPTLFKMQYDGAPVTMIFKALEENYGVDIVYDEEILKGCVLTTSMAEEGLYDRIRVICKAINAEYNIEDAVIYIKSRGC